MYSFIELLRALAAMLITNSHFDGVYPWNISWGGMPRGISVFCDKRIRPCEKCL